MLYQPYQNNCYRNCSSFVLDSSLTSLWYKIEAELAPWSTTWTRACFSIKMNSWLSFETHFEAIWTSIRLRCWPLAWSSEVSSARWHVLPHLHDMFIVWLCKGKIVDDIVGIRHPLSFADESPCLAQAINVHCGCWLLIRKFHGLSPWWR